MELFYEPRFCVGDLRQVFLTCLVISQLISFRLSCRIAFCENFAHFWQQLIFFFVFVFSREFLLRDGAKHEVGDRDLRLRTDPHRLRLRPRLRHLPGRGQEESPRGAQSLEPGVGGQEEFRESCAQRLVSGATKKSSSRKIFLTLNLIKLTVTKMPLVNGQMANCLAFCRLIRAKI